MYDDNFGEQLSLRYSAGDGKSHSSHGHHFRDIRLSKTAIQAYFSSARYLDHLAIAFVFCYSQACAFVYAKYLRLRFPKMYEFMGPWVLVSRGEAMAIIVQSCLMVLLLTRGWITRVRPFMTWSTVSLTILDKHVLIHQWLGVFLVLGGAL